MVHISLRAEEIFHIGTFPVTNTLLLSTVALFILAAIAAIFRKKLALVPAGFQNLVEFAVESLLELMDSVLGERSKSERYLPVVATVFVFILFSNWLGLMPGIGSIGLSKPIEVELPYGSSTSIGHAGGGGEFIPLFRSPASDLNFTLALALITVLAVNLLGVLALGFRPHLSKFFNFKSPIDFFVGILELVSEFAKVISFSFRLFGNVFAGEVLLVIMAFLVPYVIPLPFLFLELFVGFIQAFIFAMLTLVFIAVAVAEHGAH